MVVSCWELINEIEPNPDVLGRLDKILTDAGFEGALDIGMIPETMVGKLMGAAAEVLGDAVRKAVARASPLMEGWATNINRCGGASGLGSGGGLCSAIPPPRPARAASEPPASMCLRGVRSGLGGGERVARQSKLNVPPVSCGVLRNVFLANKNPAPPLPRQVPLS